LLDSAEDFSPCLKRCALKASLVLELLQCENQLKVSEVLAILRVVAFWFERVENREASRELRVHFISGERLEAEPIVLVVVKEQPKAPQSWEVRELLQRFVDI
jgi:hypothetical protein